MGALRQPTLIPTIRTTLRESTAPSLAQITLPVSKGRGSVKQPLIMPSLGSLHNLPAAILASNRQHESISASSMPAVTRENRGPLGQESTRRPLTMPMLWGKKRESFKTLAIRATHRLMESDGITPSGYRVELIEEGLGNLADAFYYTGECIQGCAAVFEGKKCYANHPSSAEEVTRPERDVRDVIGHFQNVNAQLKAGRNVLMGDLIIMAGSTFDWVRQQLDHAIDYATQFPGQQFIGLSINAAGEAMPQPASEFIKQSSIPAACIPKLEDAIAQGIQTLRIVNKITEAISCDLVTSAGAGGKVLEAI